MCCALLAFGSLPVSAAEPFGKVAEGFQFELRDRSVAHQGGNTLNLKVSYTYRPRLKVSEYPDFTRLARACDDFLSGYPNQTDYWEILNLKLTSQLLAKYPALASITIEIHVAPTAAIPYPRASIVTRTRP
ncbi:hypothetical protein AYO41_00935 [Verrucomicrobia bacterium SCGC AG-212-E04]|nr:hypothetical protein AYO41_00935 [Verrucomicrobia bacterium SCGC AG-212-E04]